MIYCRKMLNIKSCGQKNYEHVFDRNGHLVQNWKRPEVVQNKKRPKIGIGAASAEATLGLWSGDSQSQNN